MAAHPGARLSWVVDLDRARGEPLAKKYGARFATHLGEALADPSLHAVIVCTPPRTHAPVIEAAARAGKIGRPENADPRDLGNRYQK
jgi:myo-inositol 2-dehydrogenase/D-chiro-inositol 1-dehydrogenase